MVSTVLAKDIEVARLKIDVNEATQKAAGYKGKNDLLNLQVSDMSKQMVILKDQLTITKQEARQVGMKSSFVDPEEARQLEEAVARTIKRRRGNNHQDEREVSVNDKRVVGRNIISFVKELNFLVWVHISATGKTLWPRPLFWPSAEICTPSIFGGYIFRPQSKKTPLGPKYVPLFCILTEILTIFCGRNMDPQGVHISAIFWKKNFC